MVTRLRPLTAPKTRASNVMGPPTRGNQDGSRNTTVSPTCALRALSAAAKGMTASASRSGTPGPRVRAPSETLACTHRVTRSRTMPCKGLRP